MEVTLPPPLDLAPTRDLVCLTGAKLLSKLAYPLAEAQAECKKLQDALFVFGLRQYAQLYPDDQTILAVPANLFRFTDKTLHQQQKFMAIRLSERLIAGQMAAAYLKCFEEGKIPEALGNIKRMSVNQVSAFVTQVEGYSEPGNVRRLFWRPSKPVIHIAAALAVVGQEWTRRGEPFGFFHLLLHSDLVADVVERAIIFSEIIRKDTRFPVPFNELVPIHLA